MTHCGPSQPFPSCGSVVLCYRLPPHRAGPHSHRQLRTGLAPLSGNAGRTEPLRRTGSGKPGAALQQRRAALGEPRAAAGRGRGGAGAGREGKAPPTGVSRKLPLLPYKGRRATRSAPHLWNVVTTPRCTNASPGEDTYRVGGAELMVLAFSFKGGKRLQGKNAKHGGCCGPLPDTACGAWPPKR